MKLCGPTFSLLSPVADFAAGLSALARRKPAGTESNAITDP